MRHTTLLGLAAGALVAGCQAPLARTTHLESGAPAGATLAPPALAATSAPAAAQGFGQPVDDHWLELELALWYAGAEGEHTGGSTSGQYLDLLDDLDLGGRATVELGSPRSHWALIADFSAFQPEEKVTAFTSETTLLVGQVDIAYRPGDQHGYELLVGARFGQADTEVTGLGAGELEDQWVEPVLGLRGDLPLTESVSVPWRFDVGGFGLEETVTWQAEVELRWKIGRSTDLALGYRHLDLHIDEIDDTDDELKLMASGPYLGIAFRF